MPGASKGNASKDSDFVASSWEGEQGMWYHRCLSTHKWNIMISALFPEMKKDVQDTFLH